MINYLSKKVTKVLGLVAFMGLSGVVSAQPFTWSQAGPVYNAGRARNIVIDKTDPSGQTIYVGSTSSGMFKTNNGGALWWYGLNSNVTVRNISYMAQGIDGKIYIATGEGFLRPGQITKAQLGTGFYKLNPYPADTTLTRLSDSTATGHIITRIACSPVDANVIALASSKGIMVSSDGGANFSLASIPVTANSKYGMDVKFDNTGILYCSVGNERGAVASVNFSSIPSKVYKSSSANLNAGFIDITPISSLLSDSNYGRIELAISPSNNNVVYASCAKKSNNNANSASLSGVFVSYDGGATWGLVLQGAAQLDPLTDGAITASGDYAHVIVVHPTDPDQILLGSYNLWAYQRVTGTNTQPIGAWGMIGSNFFPNSQHYLHENIHDIRRVPGNPDKYYFVTDAGIYRSIDLTAPTASINGVSFQPFYKGLVTGQFNSVSIETFPINTNTNTTPGTSADPVYGFIGGTGGNGLNYFSGSLSTVLEEVNYLEGEVYNSELSKILSDAAILSIANGNMYRSSDVRTSEPTLMSYNSYTGGLPKITPSVISFNVGATTTGSPFKTWENYGQIAGGPDKAVFYNDSLTGQASIVGIATLTTAANFKFSVPRPNKHALIDSIVVRTATVVLPISGVSANVADSFKLKSRQTIYIKLADSYSVSNTSTTIPPITSTLGPLASIGVTLDASTYLDDISVTFTAPPFAPYTTPYYPVGASGSNIAVADPAAYYRVYATVFYKYPVGDTISVTDNNISTKTNIYSTVLTHSLSWRYGASNTYTLAYTNTVAVTNPTYGINASRFNQNVSAMQSSPVFTVHPGVSTTYTIWAYGTYTISRAPLLYPLTANTNTTLPGPTYSFVLMPGNVTQTVTVPAATTTPIPPIVFSVPAPTVSTNYTITQYSSSSTLTAVTFSTIDSPTYVLNPGSISQVNNPTFTVTVTSPTVYTITALSSPVASFSNNITFPLPAKTVSTVGSPAATIPLNNTPIQIPMKISARLAMYLSSDNAAGVTGSQSGAVLVSKAPLNLNDPLNFVRISQSGCLTTKSDGSPDTNKITIDGIPTILQWSNAGTELYYATDQNKLYRVSYINLIMDYAPASYSGKLNTDIFKYATNGVGTSATGINPASPYRTTLLGTFTKRITSISIGKDDQGMMLTLDDAGNGPLVMYASGSVPLATANATNVGFTAKGSSGSGLLSTATNANVKVYCSILLREPDTLNSPSKKALLGTENGIFYTPDITSGSPAWTNVNNSQLPNVQVFDIKQQTMRHFECYNSGQIYVATNGRGVWTNTANFYVPWYNAIQENKLDKEKNISIFPNPTNGQTFISFNGIDGESAVLNIMDLSGRIVKTENMGKLSSGQVNYSFDTRELTSGIYLVDVKSTGNTKRVTKLIVTK